MKQVILNKARDKNPLIHHLTNQVVMNFSANGLLSFGGAPVMAKANDEVYDMASIADGVLLNIGTLNANVLSAMITAGQAANKKGIPVVLDPVGVAATPFRTAAFKSIVENVRLTAIKGNAGEMAHLVEIPWKTKGVESIGGGNTEEIAYKVAKTYQTAAVVTGKTDVISTGNRLIQNDSGHSYLTKITGAGCLLGSVITACLTTDDPIEDQLETAISFYGLAAEHAASQPDVTGPGTFLPKFIDALALDLNTMQGDN